MGPWPRMLRFVGSHPSRRRLSSMVWLSRPLFPPSPITVCRVPLHTDRCQCNLNTCRLFQGIFKPLKRRSPILPLHLLTLRGMSP